MKIGFFGLLTLIFITLKLTHVIAWSWFWVLSPFIFPVGLWLGIVLLYGIVCVYEWGMDKYDKR